MRGILRSPVGDVIIDTGERGMVCCGTWLKREPPGDDSGLARRHLEAARGALAEYFAGRRRSFEDLSLAPEGTAFQRSVWRALCDLPYASTTSYGELAARIGRPRSVRAVGQANARNPIGIVQPCHRVIGADGSLVGFGGGLPMKRWLLEHERRVAAESTCENL